MPFWTLPIVMHVLGKTPVSGDTPFCALFPGAIVWYAFLGVVTYGAISGTRVLRRFAADRATGEWTVEQRGIAGLLPRRTSIPLAEIDRLVVSLWWPSLGHRARQLALAVRYDRRGAPGARLPGFVRVEGLDRKEEAIDLALRLAAIVGLGAYTVTESTGQIVVEATREAGEGTLPLLVPAGAAEYARLSRAEESDPLLEPPGAFDPAAWVGEERIVRWEPGKVVVLDRPFQGRAMGGCLLGCGVVCLSGLAMSVIVWLGSGGGAGSLVALCTPWVVLYALGAALAWSNAGSAARVIDWATKAVRLGARHEVPFAEIERIEVRLERVITAQPRGEPFRPSFQGRVLLVLRHPVRMHVCSEVLAQTRVIPEDRLAAYRPALSMSVAVASSLGVPWVFLNASGP